MGVLGTIEHDRRREVGILIKRIADALQDGIDARGDELRDAEETAALEAEAVDVTLPGRAPAIGTHHIIQQVIDEVVDIFVSLGFTVARGPEAETSFYNFTALNNPETHPHRRETDPLDPDTDGDGFIDGAEWFLGSNPTDGESTPGAGIFRVNYGVCREGEAIGREVDVAIVEEGMYTLALNSENGPGFVAPRGGRVRVGGCLGCRLIRPRPVSGGACVGVVSGTGPRGRRLVERLPYFVSGVHYPDCIVIGPEMLTDDAEGGVAGIRVAGIFGPDWSVDRGDFAEGEE